MMRASATKLCWSIRVEPPWIAPRCAYESRRCYLDAFVMDPPAASNPPYNAVTDGYILRVVAFDDSSIILHLFNHLCCNLARHTPIFRSRPPAPGRSVAHRQACRVVHAYGEHTFLVQNFVLQLERPSSDLLWFVPA